MWGPCGPQKTLSGAYAVIPSCVSGRGYKIGPVCQFVRLSVCLSVSALTTELYHDTLCHVMLWCDVTP